jgi:hypothetical protein
LPQYHPIPENDEWWGRGFTEWTNVAKARPLFRNHYQPRVPADLGFYDLRLPETRAAQAELVEAYGIEGFCYWHYWFAGKRLLERPFNEVLKSGEPKLPFCLAWANDSWTGIWHGAPDRMLIEQTYPGREDEVTHFHSLLAAFCDERYLKIDGQPVFVIHNPYRLPEPSRLIDTWKQLAVNSGLKGIYFIANVDSMAWPANRYGFDALIPHNPGMTTSCYHSYINSLKRLCPHFQGNDVTTILKAIYRKPDTIPYGEYIRRALPPPPDTLDAYPCVVPGWDNTPRCGINGFVLQGSQPELFRAHLRSAIQQVAHRNPDKRVIFIKSWNEWAEGNYLEPDLRFGRSYLEVCKEEVSLGSYITAESLTRHPALSI